MKLKRYIKDIHKLKKHFGLSFALKCTAKRIVSFSRYERFVFNYLSDFFDPVISEFKKCYQRDTMSDAIPKKVWTLWWQGEETAPEIVKVCIESQKKAFSAVGAELVVLTSDNWRNYISLPEHIINKVENGIITLTHFSDIIRAELLKTHGGIWIDATVYCTKPVEESVFANPLFTVKYQENSDALTLRRWTGFFFGDRKNSELFSFMNDAFNYYWAKKNELVAYLLIDYVIAIAYDNFSGVKKDIDNVPVSNQRLWDMLRKMNDKYDSKEWNSIVKDTSFLKLSYKDEFNGGPLLKANSSGELTYWGHISSRDK